MLKKPVKEKYSGMAIRLSPEARRQLGELRRCWGENASACVRRAIAIAYADARANDRLAEAGANKS